LLLHLLHIALAEHLLLCLLRDQPLQQPRCRLCCFQLLQDCQRAVPAPVMLEVAPLLKGLQENTTLLLL
jgi:hypothetical protein